MPSVLNATSLPDNDPLLDDLQCNTLAPHRRNLSVHLFFRLGGDAAKNREYLRTWADAKYSLGAQVREEAQRRVERATFVRQAFQADRLSTKAARFWEFLVRPQAAAWHTRRRTSEIIGDFLEEDEAKRSLVKSIMLSSTGLLKLEPWSSRAPGSEDRRFPALDPAWRRGMYYDEKNLSIGGVEHFEQWTADLLAGRNPRNPRVPQGIDVQVMLAEDGDWVADQAMPAASCTLLREIAKVEDDIVNGLQGTLVAKRWGYLARLPGQGYQEHFGFRDGISNVHTLDGERQKALDDFASPDHGTTLRNLLFELPLRDGRLAYGSYSVFRQIRERLDAPEVAQLEALIGRKANGSPLVPYQKLDGFDFSQDAGPAPRCPFHAHIRKSNPRKSSGDPNKEAAFLFARRGMLYGDRGFDHAKREFKDTTNEVGLLFMACMGSIDDQFSAMQRQWLAEPGFPQASKPPSADRIVGLPPTDPLSGLTVVRGGEYFFVPPLSWLADPAPRGP